MSVRKKVEEAAREAAKEAERAVDLGKYYHAGNFYQLAAELCQMINNHACEGLGEEDE